MMITTEQHSTQQRFNGLLSLEDGDQLIRKDGILEHALAELGPLFLKHGVSKFWALALLHNHWALQERESPVQLVVRSDFPREYVSKPCDRSVHTRLWPIVLALSDADEKLIVTEFSDDPGLEMANALLANSHSFVQAFSSTVRQNGWQNIFGLIALHDLAPGYELVESNYLERISVLREIQSSAVDKTRVVQTSWKFVAGGATKCETYCWKHCTIPAAPNSQHVHEHRTPHK